MTKEILSVSIREFWYLMVFIGKASFKHVLKSLELYTRNHVGTIPSDKGEVILNNSLAMMENYQTLSNKEDLEVQLQFLNLLMIMAKNSPIIFNFKHKFINHGYSTLKTLYERKQKEIRGNSNHFK